MSSGGRRVSQHEDKLGEKTRKREDRRYYTILILMVMVVKVERRDTILQDVTTIQEIMTRN